MRIAINGLGRIGRLLLRRLSQEKNIKVVAINDIVKKDDKPDTKVLSHLIKYDTIYGKFDGVSFNEEGILIGNHFIKAFCETNPEKLPWKDLDVHLVVESSGKFTKRNDAYKHIIAGAETVLISAPCKDKDVKTVVYGINHSIIEKEDQVISNSSCTTNCVAPLIKVLNDEFGIESAFITTVHAYTADQRLQDSAHSDLRRARAAALNIVPTTTGAASAIVQVFPLLKGKLSGSALRVPVITGSLTEVYAYLKKSVNVDDVNNKFKEYASNTLSDILEYSEEPLVSSDIIGNPHSAIFDAGLTAASDRFVKVSAWYDNEYGYVCRLVDVIKYIGKIKGVIQKEKALS